MLHEKMQKAMNEQINAEIFSSYLYLSMAAYFDAEDLPGFAGWMKAQAQEELFHAMKFYGYMTDRSARVAVTPIAGPDTEWSSPMAAFKAALAHEQKVTALINDLVALARDLKDFATDNLLQWFVAEQVEEEASADAIINKLKLVGKEGTGLFMIDQELGQRVFTLPPATEG